MPYFLSVRQTGSGVEKTRVAYSSEEFDNIQTQHVQLGNSRFHAYGSAPERTFLGTDAHIGECKVRIPGSGLRPAEAVDGADFIIHPDGTVLVRDEIIREKNRGRLDSITRLAPQLYREFVEEYP